jgi:hypothetical protein
MRQGIVLLAAAKLLFGKSVILTQIDMGLKKPFIPRLDRIFRISAREKQ